MNFPGKYYEKIGVCGKMDLANDGLCEIGSLSSKI
jgi:hypothetical protein